MGVRLGERSRPNAHPFSRILSEIERFVTQDHAFDQTDP